MPVSTTRGNAPRRSVALSQLELRVMRLVACGLTNKEIAWRLATTEPMIKKRLTAIYRLLRIRSRTEVVIWCLQHADKVCSTDAQVIVDGSLHPAGCQCSAIYCSAMRLALPDEDLAA